ncbi:MAG: hypothetical protein WAX07_00775 [Candidatus Altiarchaeia archaeon]
MSPKPGSLADLNRQANCDWFDGEESSIRHSSLAAIREYDLGLRKRRVDPLYYVKAMLLLSVVYLSWVAFHESLHYASCSLPGNRAYIASILPTPAIACMMGGTLSPYGAFLYYMSPYIAAIIVLAVFCRVQSSLLHLIPYTAFFDLQYNLLATSLIGGKLNGRENDVLSLMRHVGTIGQSSGLFNIFYGLSVAFLIGLSLLVFYYGYRDDLSDSRYRDLFIAAFLFYTVFYTAGTISLYY